MNSKGLKLALSLTFTGLLYATAVPASDLVVAAADATASKKAKLIDLWKPGDSGQRMNIRGRVTSPDGTPLSGIAIGIRQPDGDGDWIEQYSATLTTDAKGRYQFGSVVPDSQYCGDPHVQVSVYENGWKYYDTSIVFDNDPTLAYHGNSNEPIFLEESSVEGESVLYGRFDIVLTPQ